MRKCWTLLLCSTLFCITLAAQTFTDEEENVSDTVEMSSEDKFTTYALVVGISDYKHKRIPDLKFAHRDAEIFANYLRSTAGGSLPEGNIHLLTEKEATHEAIYAALDEIKDKVAEGDKVIIYFSGHGDKETDEFDQLGYLLAYNTPFNNYRNNSVRIQDLNLDARTLTLKKGAEVIFYLDACHAGALSGSENSGPSLSASDMEKLSGKEVRFMACTSKQKSLEVDDLDGGRGLFSYYLVRGLLGEADENEDTEVILEELKDYVTDAVKKHAKSRQHKQVPEIKGKPEDEEYPLALVDDAIVGQLKSSPGIMTLDLFGGDKPMMTVAVTTPSPDGLADPIQEPDVIEEDADESMASTRVRGVRVELSPLLISFNSAIEKGSFIGESGDSAYEIYLNEKANNPESNEVNKMKRRLIVVLQEAAQEAINAYLDGDYEEVARRTYEVSASSYNQYPEYLKIAADLAGPDYSSYDAIKTKEYYFAGINHRLGYLMGETFSEEDWQTAMDYQLKALAIDDKSAYVHNEIGVLKSRKGDQKEAMASFQKAHKLSPTWVIPITNMSKLFLVEENEEEAIKWAKSATTLRPNYAPANMVLGAIYAKRKNYLFSEMHYRKAMLDNWKGHLSFEKLAQYYTTIGQYELADHLFKEAAFRKQGLFPTFQLTSITVDAASLFDVIEESFDEAALLARIRANPDDYEAWFDLGRFYIGEGRLEESETSFLQVERIKPDYCPLYSHFGSLYEVWNRFDDAIAVYYKGMNLAYDLMETGAETYDCSRTFFARKIYPLYEKLERNEEAERIIIRYDEDGLWSFYGRMVTRYPEDPSYYYKRGLLVYKDNYTSNVLDNEEGDIQLYTATWKESVGRDSDTGKEIFLDRSMDVALPDQERWEYYWGNPVIEDFEKTLELSTNHPSRGDINLKLGELHQTRSKMFGKAIFDERRMLKQGIVSKSNIQHKNYQQHISEAQTAIEYNLKAQERYPDQLRSKHRLIELYLSVFEPQSALDLLLTLKDTVDRDLHHRRKIAELQMLMGDLENANHSLSFALDKNVGPGREDLELASWYHQFKGDYTKALELWNQSLSHYDQVSGKPVDSGTAEYRKAVLHALNGKKNKALKALEKAFQAYFEYRHVINYEPAFDQYRDDGKFNRLIDEYRLSAEAIIDPVN